MPPEEAAAVWLSPVKVQEDTTKKNTLPIEVASGL
jgi:hypothetical protein